VTSVDPEGRFSRTPSTTTPVPPPAGPGAN
jgi:hypothetical protein